MRTKLVASESLAAILRALVGSVALATVAVVITACGGSSPSTGTKTVTAIQTAAGTAVTGGQNIQGDKVMFEAYDAPSSASLNVVRQGAEAAAKVFGLQLTTQYASNDDATAVSQIGTAVASHYAGIIAKVPDPGVAKAGCQALKAGIPFVAVNNGITTGPYAKCQSAIVGENYTHAGEIMASYLVDHGYVKKGDQVFCPTEFETQPYSVQSAAGANSVLSKLGIKCDVVGTNTTDLAQVQATMVQYLLGHRNTAAIISLGSSPIAVAPTAVKKAGLHPLPTVGLDISFPQEITGIKNGTMLGATSGQQYMEGFFAVEEVALKLKFGLQPVTIDTSAPTLITKANIGNTNLG